MKCDGIIVHSILNLQREDVASTTALRISYTMNPKDPAFRQSQSSLSAFQRTMKSRFSYTENQSTIHLASDALVKNTQRMVVRNGATDTMKTNIMETIQVVVVGRLDRAMLGQLGAIGLILSRGELRKMVCGHAAVRVIIKKMQ